MTALTRHAPAPAVWTAGGICAAAVAGAVAALAGPIPLAGIAAGIALLVAMARAPGLVLGAYLLIPYYKAEIQPLSPVDITVLLALANAAQAIPVLFAGRRPSGAALRVAVWLALGGVVLAGVLYAPDQSLAMGKAVTYWALVVLPLVPAALRVASEPRQLALVALSFYAHGLLVSILGLDLLSPDSRLTVLGMNTIQVARAALFLPIVGVLYIIPMGRRWLTLLTLAVLPVSLLVTVASGSRGPVLAIAILAAAGAIRHLAAAGRVRARALAAAGGIAILGVTAVAIIGPSLPAASLARFGDLLAFAQGAGGGQETSAAARVVLFGAALQLWAASPVLGTGTGGFQVLSAQLLGPAGDAYPHNAILQVLAEYGLVGLAVFAAVLGAGALRRLPAGTLPRTIRALYLFFALNAMVSGDIVGDRETLGLLLLVLVIPLPAATAGREPGGSEGGPGRSAGVLAASGPVG